MHAIIFAGGTLRPGKAVNRAIAAADLIIAADKGERFNIGITPMPHGRFRIFSHCKEVIFAYN